MDGKTKLAAAALLVKAAKPKWQALLEAGRLSLGAARRIAGDEAKTMMPRKFLKSEAGLRAARAANKPQGEIPGVLDALRGNRYGKRLELLFGKPIGASPNFSGRTPYEGIEAMVSGAGGAPERAGLLSLLLRMRRANPNLYEAAASESGIGRAFAEAAARGARSPALPERARSAHPLLAFLRGGRYQASRLAFPEGRSGHALLDSAMEDTVLKNRPLYEAWLRPEDWYKALVG